MSLSRTSRFLFIGQLALVVVSDRSERTQEFSVLQGWCRKIRSRAAE
jgi:hypothetical protein